MGCHVELLTFQEAWTCLNALYECMLQRRFILASWCLICRVEEELTDHLPVHCRSASWLWHLSLSLMLVSRVQPPLVRDVVVAWRRRLKKELGWVLGICKLTPLVIWWSTWKERNCQIFEGKDMSYQAS